MKQTMRGVGTTARALSMALALAFIYAIVGVATFTWSVASAMTTIGTLGAGPVIGQVTESTVPATNRIREVSLSLTMIAPSRYPLDTIRRRAAARGKMVRTPTARNTKHEWFEADVIPRATTVDGTVTGGSTSDTVVVDAAIFRPNDLAYLPDNSAAAGHVLYVEAVDSTGLSLTVSRVNMSASESAFQNTVAIADGEAIYKIGNAHEEASAVGNGIGTYPLPLYNYYQIKDTVVDHSLTQAAISEYGMNSKDLSERQALLDYRRSLSLNDIFGHRFSGTFASQKLRMQAGITQYITTNALTYTAGSMTEGNIIDWCKTLFYSNNGSGVRYWFPTPTQSTEVDKLLLATSGLRWNRNDQVLGVKCTTVETQAGTLKIFPMQDLEEHGKTNWGLVIDPKNVGWSTLREMSKEDATTPGSDSKKTRWLEESTLEVNHEETHAIIYATATDSPR